MLQLNQRIKDGVASGSLTLPLDSRIRSRLRVTLDDGTEAGVVLERGHILRHGDLIGSNDGRVIEVRAAPESVSVVHLTDTLLLSRLCYHLGNRHVPLQIGSNTVSYQHDHVLDEMVRGLGAEPQTMMAPFEPEAGAYESHTHHHSHDHEQGDAHNSDAHTSHHDHAQTDKPTLA